MTNTADRLQWTTDEHAITVHNDDTRHGLIGIAERAAACGGSAEYGTVAGTDEFRAGVRLPIEGKT